MIGRQVTTRSRSPTTSSSVTRGRRRKISIHALVSTSRSGLARTVNTATFAGHGSIAAHVGQMTRPQSRAGELLDAAHLGATHHLLERALDGARIGALAAHTNGLLEQLLIKHNIRAFHVYSVTRRAGRTNLRFQHRFEFVGVRRAKLRVRPFEDAVLHQTGE